MQSGRLRQILLLSGMAWVLVFARTSGAQQDGISSTQSPPSSRLSCKPCVLQFGRVDVKHTKALSVTLTNGGKTSIRVSRIRRSSPAFGWGDQALPFTIAPGHSRTLRISFQPSVKGDINGNLEFLSNAADSSSELRLHGTGVTGSLISTPSQISFGDVRTRSAKAEYATVRNSSSMNVKISAVTTSDNEFSVRGLSLPLTLRTGESYTFKAVFWPKSPGKRTGSLTVVSNAADSALEIRLLGNGTPDGELRLGATTLDFGTVKVGARKNLRELLLASGAPVTVTSATSDSAEFRISGVAFPVHLAPGQSLRFTVDFAPQNSGSARGKLSFHSNAADSSLSAVLMGNGTAAQHSVTLEWSASATRVKGYNVYRSEAPSQKYSRLNGALDSQTAFTDVSVESGKNYYYVTTAVSAAGVESSYSNRVEAIIP
jgi:hypothetical protein